MQGHGVLIWVGVGNAMNAESVCHVCDLVLCVGGFANLGHRAMTQDILDCGSSETSFCKVSLEHLHDAVCFCMTMQRQFPV